MSSVRVVAVADTHLHHRGLVVPDGDVFVHAGDLCREGTLKELSAAARWIRSLPHRAKVVVAGNHDWAFAREPEAARAELGADVVYLEDNGATVAGLRFWGSPWQPEFGGWAFNFPRGGHELAAKWALIPEGLDVLVTHGPPFGIGDRVAFGRHEGCAALRRRVLDVAPRVHLFGHIHEDPGLVREGHTLFANVTTREGELGATVFSFDAAAVRAECARA